MKSNLTIILTLAVAMLAGCQPEAQETTAEQVTEIKAKLAKADAFDGKDDKTVTKCAGCKLGMDGFAKHTVEAHGYKILFCAEGCKDHFAETLDQSILAMTVPEKKD